jgi:adenine-specific DNA-methyltransferase
MIYIDPPYNTGNDFIYPDNYSENLQTYLEYTGQVDSGGHRFSNNTETDGRFHSKWLNMMYPRIFLARNLLTEDGVMFVSIDDHESHNLRRICDEVFGESNFICTFTWEKRYSPPPDTKDVGYVHENILLYRKSDSYRMGLLPTTQDQQDRYKNPDNDPRGPWKPMDYTCRYTKDERPNLYYEITNPNTKSHVLPKDTRVWAFSHDVHLSNVSEKRIW